MLIASGARRDAARQFKLDRRLDIFDDGRSIGQLSCDLGATQAALTVNDKSYTIATTTADPHEPLAELLLAADTRAKRAGTTLALKDADGQTRALAQQVRSGFMVAHEGTVFTLRKGSFFSPPYLLFRSGSDQSLGSVGQKSLFSRTLFMDLPAGFEAAFRVFLLLLSLHVATQRAANQGAYN
jgi:hypothetical protein